MAAALDLGATVLEGCAGTSRDGDLIIAYSASLNGYLDGCTWKRKPVAGLVKRAAFLRGGDNAATALLLDAGDLLEDYLDAELARHILKVHGELGYEAIALGDQELAHGLDRRSVAESTTAGVRSEGFSIPEKRLSACIPREARLPTSSASSSLLAPLMTARPRCLAATPGRARRAAGGGGGTSGPDRSRASAALRR